MLVVDNRRACPEIKYSFVWFAPVLAVSAKLDRFTHAINPFGDFSPLLDHDVISEPLHYDTADRPKNEANGETDSVAMIIAHFHDFRRMKAMMTDPSCREHLAKMNRGKQHSAETRERMSKSQSQRRNQESRVSPKDSSDGH
jgi:hypothetical protein